jgi:glc operon protein GlcG
MRTKPCLTASDAATMMAACKAEAAKNEWNVCVAIVDEGGYLVALERMDGAHLLTPDAAIGKARTAALMRKPSRVAEERIASRPAFLRFPEIMPVIGAVPVIHDGECIGAVGVAGVQSDDDERIAQVGVDALGNK